MTTVHLQEIQRDPLGYLRRVEAGETLVVVRDDRPIAEIKPIPLATGTLRPFGLCAGEFEVPDDFDHALPDSILAEFDGQPWWQRIRGTFKDDPAYDEAMRLGREWRESQPVPEPTDE